jgi:polyisoprenoid-binding protein YceI
MRFRPKLWLYLLAVVVANGSPVLVDPNHSSIDIAVKATIGSFVAQLRDFDANIVTASREARVEAGIFRFKFASIKTGNAARDRDMNEWQQTDKFPEVVFTLIAIEPVAGGNPIARGKLRFHGVERLLSFPISVETKEQTFNMDGDVAIDTRNYGLPIIKSFLVLKVDPIVHVHFHLTGKLADS